MNRIWIPAHLQHFTNGSERVEISGSNIRQVIRALDNKYPGLGEQLREGDMLTPGMTVAISGTPTNTDQTQQLDNLIFDSKATREFTGRSGTLNLMRQYNLSLQEALEVSDHLPVWAEFSIHENGEQAAEQRPAEQAQAPETASPR